MRATFLINRERLNVWNSFQENTVDFNSLSRFKCSVLKVDFSGFLKCFYNLVATMGGDALWLGK